jgi:hypothetical protein
LLLSSEQFKNIFPAKGHFTTEAAQQVLKEAEHFRLNERKKETRPAEKVFVHDLLGCIFFSPCVLTLRLGVFALDYAKAGPVCPLDRRPWSVGLAGGRAQR